MKRSPNRWIGVVAGIALAMASVGTAAAYWAQTPATITIFGPNGKIKCGESVTFRAGVRDANGDPVPNGGAGILVVCLLPAGGGGIGPPPCKTQFPGGGGDEDH